MSKIAFFLTLSLLITGSIFAFDEEITVPAENSGGIIVNLEQGEYIVTIAGGAIALFYPVNPNYRWLVSVAIGTGAEGWQDLPNIGTIYFEPNPPVYNQAKAEEQAIKAAKENLSGTSIIFSLKEDSLVRFWVSDFDYTDNSGMVKLTIRSVLK